MLLVSACAGPTKSVRMEGDPRAVLTLPGEFEPVDEVLLGWEGGNWEHLPFFTTLAQELASSRTRLVLVGTAEDRGEFVQHLEASGVDAARLGAVDAVVDTMWIRDYGPVYVRSPAGELLVVDLPYHEDRPHDDALPEVLAFARGQRSIATKLPLEGGHLQADGAGRCVITDDAMQRAVVDAGLTPAEVESELRELFGCFHVTWVPALIGEETGHLDMFALLTGPGQILVGEYTPSSDPENAQILDEVARLLTVSGFRVTRVPMPSNEHGLLFRTHTNALIVDDAVFVPIFEHERGTEQRALQVFARAFPGRRIVPIDSSSMITLAGAVHCATRGVPRGRFELDRPGP